MPGRRRDVGDRRGHRRRGPQQVAVEHLVAAEGVGGVRGQRIRRRLGAGRRLGTGRRLGGKRRLGRGGGRRRPEDVVELRARALDLGDRPGSAGGEQRLLPLGELAGILLPQPQLLLEPLEGVERARGFALDHGCEGVDGQGPADRALRRQLGPRDGNRLRRLGHDGDRAGVGDSLEVLDERVGEVVVAHDHIVGPPRRRREGGTPGAAGFVVPRLGRLRLGRLRIDPLRPAIGEVVVVNHGPHDTGPTPVPSPRRAVCARHPEAAGARKFTGGSISI